MIGYLKGEILENLDGHLLVTVSNGPGGSVGYAVTVPQSSSYRELATGKSVELFIYTHVREDIFDLFGFRTRGEKALFLNLLDVSGIGPKLAIGMLSNIEPAQLIQVILEKDKTALVDLPGIGKKTAELILLQLSDSMRKKLDAGAFSDLRVQNTPAGASLASGRQGVGDGKPAVIRDAREALIGLGYREGDVMATLNQLLSMPDAPHKVDDLIRSALKNLHR